MKPNRSPEPQTLEAVLREVEVFLPGLDLLKEDPRMASANRLQRLGLVSARPHDAERGWFVRVRVTDQGYAALGRQARR